MQIIKLDMTKELIIEKTIKVINQLPENKAEEISNFADYLFKKFEEEDLKKGIAEIISTNESFSFLNEEEEIYSLNDLKTKI